MGAVGMRLRADVRHRWLGVVGVTLLVGLAGAVVFTAAAGARRTSTTITRISQATHAADVLVNPDETPPAGKWSSLDTLPGVEATASLEGLFGGPLDANGQLDLGFLYESIIASNPDGRVFRDVDNPHLVAGRFPRPDRADEVAVNDVAARRAHLRVGQTIDFGFLSKQAVQQLNGPPVPDIKTRATVTGTFALARRRQPRVR